MKNKIIKRNKTFGLALAGVLAGAGLFGLVSRSYAADVNADQIRDAERDQLGVRGQVLVVRQQIDALLDDFDRNGLASGDDVKTLRQVRDLLADLSDEQMSKVVELLQQARGSADPTGARTSAVAAFELQKGIIKNFRELVAKTQKQQQVNTLAAWVAKLAERQNANFRATLLLARETGGKPVESWSAAQRDAGRVLAVDQGAIGEEAGQVVAQLRTLASADDQMRAKLSLAMSKIESEKLIANLADSTTQLKASALFSAAPRERAARDTLFALVQLLALDDSEAQKLQRMIDDVDKAIAQQQKIAEKLESAKPDRATAEMDQADNVDRTNRTRKEAEAMARAQPAKPQEPAGQPEASADATKNPPESPKGADQPVQKPQETATNADAPSAADALKKAEDAMQKTRGDLNAGKPEVAKQSARAAVDALQQAKAQLQEQLATATNTPMPSETDPTSADAQAAALDAAAKALDDAAKKVDEARSELADNAEQEAPGTAAPTPAEQSAAAKLDDAGKAMAQTPGAPDAAKAPLAEAKAAAEAASAAAGKGDTPGAQAQAKAAADALAKARAAVGAAQAQAQAAAAQASAQQGPPSPSDQPGPPTDAKGEPSAQATGANPDGEKETGRAAGTTGARAGANGSSKFVGLPERDRAALQQSRAEKYPAEYGPMVEQYFKNLSADDGSDGGK